MEDLIGKRVKCIKMITPPNEKPELNPIESGTEGIIYHVGGGVINVSWDNGSGLGLIEGVDQYQILN